MKLSKKMATEFQNKVYKLCKKIPKGKVTTYKIIAEKLGTKAYRAVGQALNKNPYGILKYKSKKMIPCHRVVDSRGHLHGFAHGLKKKAGLLRKEGIKINNFRIKEFKKIIFKF